MLKTKVERIERILQAVAETKVSYEITDEPPFYMKCLINIVRDGKVIGQIDPRSVEGQKAIKNNPFEFEFAD